MNTNIAEEYKNKFVNENYLHEINGYPERNVEWFKQNILPDCKQYIQDKELLLDVGCGFGYFTNLYADYSKKVVGIDFVEKRIEAANKNFKKDNLRFYVGDLTTLRTDKQFDCIIETAVIQHIPGNLKLKVFENLYNLSKPGSTFVLYDNCLDPDKPYTTNDWVDTISPKWITEALSNIWMVKDFKFHCYDNAGTSNYNAVYKFLLERR